MKKGFTYPSILLVTLVSAASGATVFNDNEQEIPVNSSGAIIQIETTAEVEKTEEQIEKEEFLRKSLKYLEDIRISSFGEKEINTVFEQSKINGLDPFIVLSQIKKESTFNGKAYNAGCIGLLQVSKYPLKEYNSVFGTSFVLNDLYDKETNIKVGTFYLGNKFKKFGDIHQALMAYNGGEGYLGRMLKQGITKTSYSKKVIEVRDYIFYF